MRHILAILVLFLGIASAKADIVVSEEDPGGDVGTYIAWWHRIADSGDRVIIDGECVSACTLLMNIVPPNKVCLTDRASFGIHLAKLNGQPDPEVTDRLQRLFYPTWFLQWIGDHVILRPDHITYVMPEVFVKAGFYKMCSPSNNDPRDWIDRLADMW